MKARVTVTLKPGVLDPAGKAVVGGLRALGFEEIHDARLGKYIELEVEPGPDVAARVEAMCRKLLANPVMEDFRIELEA
jgi:phosphoribosylformylglycinamidine synthase